MRGYLFILSYVKLIHGTTFSVVIKNSAMKQDQNKERSSRIPENDTSKAMDSKKEVEKSPDPKTDQDFPGYPHYPAKEDIMDQRTDMHRVDMDVENFAGSKNKSGVSQRFLNSDKSANSNQSRSSESEESDDELGIKEGTEADVTEDDLVILNGTNAEIGTPQNVSEEDLDDLDVPGAELDDNNEMIGEEDEENNYYSLGGERHEDLEEDPTAS